MAAHSPGASSEERHSRTKRLDSDNSVGMGTACRSQTHSRRCYHGSRAAAAAAAVVVVVVAAAEEEEDADDSTLAAAAEDGRSHTHQSHTPHNRRDDMEGEAAAGHNKACRHDGGRLGRWGLGPGQGRPRRRPDPEHRYYYGRAAAGEVGRQPLARGRRHQQRRSDPSWLKIDDQPPKYELDCYT